MLTRHVLPIVALVLVAAACNGDGDEHIPDATSTGDGPVPVDGPPPVDAPAIDAPATGAVVCGQETTTCPVPAQMCCDDVGSDTCVVTDSACAGVGLRCDGPEDCGAAEECCLFEGSRSVCVDAGVCSTTGSISNEMCHVVADCDTGENCCGTAPGPQVDLYAICTTSPCPQ